MTTRPPRLTRSTTDKKLAGVAGGVAAYFGIDPTVVRLAFVVSIAFGGFGLWAYLAALAVVPTDADAAAPGPPVTA
jgi:phage shock protein PspC (stress-responsive transcriptional regulator)